MASPSPRAAGLAHCAARIDGSRFVGDLWYGPGIGAMLFERRGEYTLALWTADDERTTELETAAQQVTRFDLMGRSDMVPTPSGKLTLNLTGDRSTWSAWAPRWRSRRFLGCARYGMSAGASALRR